MLHFKQIINYYSFVTNFYIFTLLLKYCQAYTENSFTTKYCYSCMSENFLLHWQYLDEVYYRPVNFTDHCYKISKKVNVGTVSCSNSMCVTVIEPRILAGQHIGNNIIRGCFSTVFKYGTSKLSHQTILETSCTRMPAHKLMPPQLAARSSNRSVELCWCAGQLCNDYPSVAINMSNRNVANMLNVIYLIIAMCLLLW